MNRVHATEDETEAETLFARLTKVTAPWVIYDRFDALAGTAALDLGAERVVISLRHQTNTHRIGVFPRPEPKGEAPDLRLLDMVCCQNTGPGAPLAIPDLRAHCAWKGLSAVRDGRLTGFLGAGIGFEAGGMIGALSALSVKPRVWTTLEQRYVAQLARTVGFTLQAELSQLEQYQLSEEMSELDRIIATLATDLAVPTSIYTERGDLAFANTALTQLVSLGYVSEFRCDLKTGGADPGRSAQAVDIPDRDGQMAHFRVSCAASASGMMVCHWFPDVENTN